MGEILGTVIGGTVDRLVRWFVIPVTGFIAFAAESGLLFLGFAAVWLAFAAALVSDPGALDAAWRAIVGLPLPLLGLAWLLFLPVVGGLWVWATDWPLVVRVAVIAGIAGWNLLVFKPRRGSAHAQAAES